MEFFTHFNEIEILANPKKEEAMLAFSTLSPLADESIKDFLKSLKLQIPQIYGVSIETVREDETRIEHFGNSTLQFQLSFTPFSEGEPVSLEIRCRNHTFNQVNLDQNRNLIKIIYEWANPSRQTKVVDLFCGMGNLSLALAGRAGKIIGLENNPLAVADAMSNAEQNGFSNCDYRHANVHEDIESMPDIRSADVLIVDPPRKGAKESIGRIAGLRSSKIIYVSCNPTTLARDASLLAYSGYRLNRLQLLDMFPQTYHIESIAEFVREK
jgi:23S rRNA (uracil1939-C5)-methyltransferase